MHKRTLENRHRGLCLFPVTTKLHRLVENLGGADIILDAAELQVIDTALAQIRIEGERYPETLKAGVGR